MRLNLNMREKLLILLEHIVGFVNTCVFWVLFSVLYIYHFLCFLWKKLSVIYVKSTVCAVEIMYRGDRCYRLSLVTIVTFCKIIESKSIMD